MYNATPFCVLEAYLLVDYLICLQPWLELITTLAILIWIVEDKACNVKSLTLVYLQ